MADLKIDAADRRDKQRAAIYSGNWGEIFFRSFWGVLGAAATFGVFMFWVRRRLRTHHWSHMKLLGDNMDFRGRGLQAFVIYLTLGLAVSNYVYFIYSYTKSTGSQSVNLGVNFGNVSIIHLSMLPLLLLVPYVAYRAQRYFVNYIYWRNVRFRMGTGAATYLGRSLLWFAAQLATLGLITPVADYFQRQFITKRMSYRGLKFRLSGGASDLFQHFIPLWVGGFSVAAVLIYNEFGESRRLGSLYIFPGTRLESFGSERPMVTALLFFALVATAIGYYWYASNRLAYFVRRTTLGEAEARNSISGITVFVLKMQQIGVTLGIGVVILGFVKLLHLILEQLAEVMATLSSGLHTFFYYAVSASGTIVWLGVAFGLLQTLYHARLMARIADGLTIKNPSALAADAQAVAKEPEEKPSEEKGESVDKESVGEVLGKVIASSVKPGE